MNDRPTDRELLAKLDAAENAVTRSSLKDSCVSRLRDAVEQIDDLNAKVAELEARVPPDYLLVPASEWQDRVNAEGEQEAETLQWILDRIEPDDTGEAIIRLLRERLEAVGGES